jgi:hypothetical protein
MLANSDPSVVCNNPVFQQKKAFQPSFSGRKNRAENTSVPTPDPLKQRVRKGENTCVFDHPSDRSAHLPGLLTSQYLLPNNGSVFSLRVIHRTKQLDILP